MKAYLRTPKERDRAPMHTLLFLGEDLGFVDDAAYNDCLISELGGSFFFDWGLDGHERMSPKIAAIREGMAAETGYMEVEVDIGTAKEAIALGQAYRTEMQGNSERVTSHRMPEIFGKAPPKAFQDKARELYGRIRQ